MALGGIRRLLPQGLFPPPLKGQDPVKPATYCPLFFLRPPPLDITIVLLLSLLKYLLHPRTPYSNDCHHECLGQTDSTTRSAWSFMIEPPSLSHLCGADYLLRAAPPCAPSFLRPHGIAGCPIFKLPSTFRAPACGCLYLGPYSSS